MSKLREALAGNEWLHAVDVASVNRGSIDVSVLYEPTPSGAPLLVDWYNRQRNSPDSMFRGQSTSREFLRTLLWRLVDAGFDPKTQWSWTEKNVYPSSDPNGSSAGKVDLLDLMLEDGDPQVLSALEERWGEPWTPEFLSQRTRRRFESLPPGAASVFPRLHYDVARGNQKMVNWWLSRGVDVNLVDAHGQTALFHAGQSSAPMAKLLLAKGINADAVDRFNRTAFEHWLDLAHFFKNNAPSKLVLAVFPKAKKSISTPVLARAVEHQIQTGEYLQPPTRSALVALRPHLTTSFVYGQNPDNKLGPWMNESISQGTLLEMATRQPWAASSLKSLEILSWLVANTPSAGHEQLSDQARLALLTFQPGEAVRTKAGGPPLVLEFPHMLSVAREVFSDLQGVSLGAKSSIVKALLAVSASVLEQVSAHPDPVASPHRASLLSPKPSAWLDESTPGGSLLAQTLSCAVELAEKNDMNLVGESLAKAMLFYVQSDLPVPQDTLLPALRILARFAPGSLKESALGVDSRPNEADMASSNLSLAVAWWMSAGTPQDMDVFQAAAAPEQLKQCLEERLGNAPGPWPTWVSIWAQRRLSQALPDTSSAPARPRSRI